MWPKAVVYCQQTVLQLVDSWPVLFLNTSEAKQRKEDLRI